MNCIEFRRLLLADPSGRTREQDEHLEQCAPCGIFSREMPRFEQGLRDAIDVPVPERLEDRILSRRKTRAPVLRVWAMAASLLVGVGIGFYLYGFLHEPDDAVQYASKLGETNPAVAAITYVVGHEARLLEEGRTGDEAELRRALLQLGLKLPSEGVSVRYLGKCPVVGGTGEHVVLETALGKVTLILVPNHPLGRRVLVTDGNMSALAVPVRKGGYILIADSIDHVKRMAKTLM